MNAEDRAVDVLETLSDEFSARLSVHDLQMYIKSKIADGIRDAQMSENQMCEAQIRGTLFSEPTYSMTQEMIDFARKVLATVADAIASRREDIIIGKEIH